MQLRRSARLVAITQQLPPNAALESEHGDRICVGEAGHSVGNRRRNRTACDASPAAKKQRRRGVSNGSDTNEVAGLGGSIRPAGMGQACADWGLLPEDMWGHVSTHLDMKAARSLVFAWGLDNYVVATIRRSYLRLNFGYLHIALLVGSKREQLSHAMVCTWMKYNGNWREMYDWDPDQFPGGEIDRLWFRRIFSDINEATRSGLVDIVRHLVEGRGEDVNAIDTKVGPISEIQGRPLFYAITMSPFNGMLEYLLSVDSIDDCCILMEPDGFGVVVTGLPLRIPLGRFSRLVSQIGKDALNHRSRPSAQSCTPLHMAVGFAYCTRDSESERVSVAKIQVLLEAGADPCLRDINDQTPREQFMNLWRRRGRDGRPGRMRVSVKKEVLALLLRYERE